MAGPQAWLAGPQAWLDGPEGGTDLQSYGRREISPFYRTSSPIGAAAQKRNENTGIRFSISGYASPHSAYALISHQADVKPELYAYAPSYATGANANAAASSSDLYATANHDAFSTVLTNQMYSSFPAAVAAAAATAADGSSYDAAAAATAAAAAAASRSPYSNAIYALDPMNHPYAHSLKYHAANTTASYSDLLGPKYAAFDVR